MQRNHGAIVSFYFLHVYFLLPPASLCGVINHCGVYTVE